jgi:hypothetical protein
MMVIPAVSAARPAYAVDLACQVTGDYNNIGPDTPGGGVEGLLPRVALWDKNPAYVIDGSMPHGEGATPATNYTLWELNGTSGLDFATSGENLQGKGSCSVWDTTLSQVAQIVFEVPRFVVSITNSMQEMATTNQPVTPLLDQLDGGHTKSQGVVSQLFRWVTLPGAVVALAATGFWIMSRSGRRRKDSSERHDREIVDGVLWAVGATGLVLFLLIGNMWRTYLDVGDKAVGSFNSAVSSALLPNIGATGPCKLPDNANDRGQRVSICNFYKTFAFDPWARGQFGSAGGHQLVGYCLGDPDLTQADDKNSYKSFLAADKWDVRMFQVEAQSYNLNDWYLVRHDSKNAIKLPPTAGEYSPWGAVRSQMQGKVKCSGGSVKYQADYTKAANALTPYYSDWKGANGFQRIGTALSDALLCILCALPPLLASMLAFMFQILAWLAIFALPIVGVAGIFPPFRRWLMSLLQILLASYFARFAFGVALTMTELAYGIVFSSPFPFGVQILILLVIVVAAMHLIRAVREAGLTSSWSRAVHGSAAGMAGTAGRQAGRMGRTVLAGAAGGAAAVVLEERRERRTRRNTVDRPVTREETVTDAPQTMPSERPAGSPQVSPRRRRAGVVISADGTTSESDGALPGGRRGPRADADLDDAPQDGSVGSRNGSRDDALPTNGPARTSGADDGGRPAEGPRVARRLRSEDAPQPTAGAAQPQPAVVAPSRQGATSAPIEPRRRQSTAQAPDSTPPPPPPRAPESDPVQRRQGDRARFVDPEP